MGRRGSRGWLGSRQPLTARTFTLGRSATKVRVSPLPVDEASSVGCRSEFDSFASSREIRQSQSLTGGRTPRHRRTVKKSKVHPAAPTRVFHIPASNARWCFESHPHRGAGQGYQGCGGLLITRHMYGSVGNEEPARMRRFPLGQNLGSLIGGSLPLTRSRLTLNTRLATAQSTRHRNA